MSAILHRLSRFLDWLSPLTPAASDVTIGVGAALEGGAVTLSLDGVVRGRCIVVLLSDEQARAVARKLMGAANRVAERG